MTHSTLLLIAQAADGPDSSRLQAIGTLLIYLFVLLMVFIVGSWFFLRASRRFWSRLDDRRPDPTPTDDVWAMHKLPDEQTDEPDEDTPP